MTTSDDESQPNEPDPAAELARRTGVGPMTQHDEDLALELAELGRKLQALTDEWHSFGEDVNGNLTKAMSDLRDLSGWVGEAAPLLQDIQAGLAAHAARLEEDSETLLELTEHVKALLQEMPRQPKYPPICWVRLTAAEAEEAWTTLGDWLAKVLVARYFVNRAHLPDCWPLHPGAVEELTWLYNSWEHAFLKTAGAVPAAEWHARWRNAALTNVHDAVEREVKATPHWTKCTPGKHLGNWLPGVDRSDYEPEPAEAPTPALVGAASSPAPWDLPPDADANGHPAQPRKLDPSRDRAAELAEPRFWMPQLVQAKAADVARRAEAEAAAAEAEHTADAEEEPTTD